MSEIKVGDVVKRADGMEQDVLAVYGDFAWLSATALRERRDSKTLGWSGGTVAHLSKLIKVEPFFEAGKTYQRRTRADLAFHLTFEVVRVDTEGDGSRVAYGRVSASDDTDAYRWAIRHSFTPGWEEV